MIEEFIIDTYLKKGEALEKGFQPITENISEYTIIKQTARTYKRVALLKIATKLQQTSVTPPIKLLTHKFTSNAKRQLQEPFSTIQQWLADGWIVQEIRLQPDERSAKEIHFRMGPAYFNYMHQKKNQHNQQLQCQQQQILNYFQKSNFSQDLQLTIARLSKLLLLQLDQLALSTVFKSNWSIEKRQKFLLFSIGFFQLASEAKLFDFKEIGATVFETIGGSKEFDREQEEFIEELERIFDLDVSTLGLVSLGKIVPVFFSGRVLGKLSEYQYGAVHAVTDDNLLQDTYKTEANNLFLVENRAVLTRMVKEPGFIENTKSLIVCLDGQIRSAHKMFIQQILSTSPLQKIIIWTDYDEAGLTIARHAAKLVEGKPLGIIARNFDEYQSIKEYAEWLQQELDSRQYEQEQQLGDEAQWRKWINQ